MYSGEARKSRRMGKQALGDQHVERRLEYLQRHVVALVDRIDHAVIDHDVELHVGILLLIFAEHQRQVAEGKAWQHMKAQHAFGRSLQVAHLVGQTF